MPENSRDALSLLSLSASVLERVALCSWSHEAPAEMDSMRDDPLVGELAVPEGEPFRRIFAARSLARVRRPAFERRQRVLTPKAPRCCGSSAPNCAPGDRDPLLPRPVTTFRVRSAGAPG